MVICSWLPFDPLFPGTTRLHTSLNVGIFWSLIASLQQATSTFATDLANPPIFLRYFFLPIEDRCDSDLADSLKMVFASSGSPLWCFQLVRLCTLTLDTQSYATTTKDFHTSTHFAEKCRKRARSDSVEVQTTNDLDSRHAPLLYRRCPYCDAPRSCYISAVIPDKPYRVCVHRTAGLSIRELAAKAFTKKEKKLGETKLSW